VGDFGEGAAIGVARTSIRPIVTRTIGGCSDDSLGVNKSRSRFRDVPVSGVAGRGRFDREAVNEFLLTIPFFTAGTGRSVDGDGLTKTVESTALISTGTSNFSGCCGSDDFSDSRIIFGAAFLAGASC
jgi:hypothetical protein